MFRALAELHFHKAAFLHDLFLIDSTDSEVSLVYLELRRIGTNTEVPRNPYI